MGNFIATIFFRKKVFQKIIHQLYFVILPSKLKLYLYNKNALANVQIGRNGTESMISDTEGRSITYSLYYTMKNT